MNGFWRLERKRMRELAVAMTACKTDPVRKLFHVFTLVIKLDLCFQTVQNIIHTHIHTHEDANINW